MFYRKRMLAVYRQRLLHDSIFTTVGEHLTVLSDFRESLHVVLPFNIIKILHLMPFVKFYIRASR